MKRYEAILDGNEHVRKYKFYYVRDKQRKPVVTVVIAHLNNGRFARGVAVCSYHDNPNKDTGKLLAARRLLKAAKPAEENDDHEFVEFMRLPKKTTQSVLLCTLPDGMHRKIEICNDKKFISPILHLERMSNIPEPAEFEAKILGM